MVAQDYHLVNFVERLTEINRGRAYYTGLDDLGRFLFVDYVRNRRRHTSVLAYWFSTCVETGKATRKDQT